MRRTADARVALPVHAIPLDRFVFWDGVACLQVVNGLNHMQKIKTKRRNVNGITIVTRAEDCRLALTQESNVDSIYPYVVSVYPLYFDA